MKGPDDVRRGPPSKEKKIGMKFTFSFGALMHLFGWIRFNRKMK